MCFIHMYINVNNNNLLTAIHNWHGDIRHGLELDVGDSVEILEEYGEWLRGTCPRKPRVVGIFPRSYIHIKDPAKSDPVVTECTQVLREWAEIWKKYYVVSNGVNYPFLIRYGRFVNIEFHSSNDSFVYLGTGNIQIYILKESDVVIVG